MVAGTLRQASADWLRFRKASAGFHGCAAVHMSEEEFPNFSTIHFGSKKQQHSTSAKKPPLDRYCELFCPPRMNFKMHKGIEFGQSDSNKSAWFDAMPSFLE